MVAMVEVIAKSMNFGDRPKFAFGCQRDEARGRRI